MPLSSPSFLLDALKSGCTFLEKTTPLIRTRGIGKHVNSASLALMDSRIRRTPVNVTKLVIRSGMM